MLFWEGGAVVLGGGGCGCGVLFRRGWGVVAVQGGCCSGGGVLLRWGGGFVKGMVLRSCQGSAGSFIGLVLGHVLHPVLKAQGTPPVRKAGRGSSPAEFGCVAARWRRRVAPQAEFVARQQDWDSPLLPFSDVATALDEAKAGTSFTAVVRCASDQPAVLSRILAGSKHAKSVLVVTVGKEQELPTHNVGFRAE